MTADSIYASDSVHRKVEDMGFFAYSGADGTLFRKHGLAGWRLSLYSNCYRIQKKSEFWEKQGKTHWVTVFQIERDEDDQFTESQKKEFLDKVKELIENGELEEEKQ